MGRIKIFDTTLRDGEQSPGCSMNLAEKLQVASQLERLGVDIIEAGFAISSPGDFESVKAIAELVKNCSVASLSRALEKDIDCDEVAQPNAHGQIVHIRDAVAAAFHLDRIGHIRRSRIFDIAVGHVAHRKSDAHRIFRRILQHRR